MTESGDTSPSAEPKKRGGLNAMRIADLKSMAGGLGIAGADGMRKPQLVAAIKGAQSSDGERSRQRSGERKPTAEKPAAEKPAAEKPPAEKPAAEKPPAEKPAEKSVDRQESPQSRPAKQARTGKQGTGSEPPPERAEQARPQQEQPKQDRPKQDRPKRDQPQQDRPKQEQAKQDQPKQDQPKQDQPKQDQPKQRQGQHEQEQQELDDQQDDGTGSRRNRRRRGRDTRESNQRPQRRSEPDTQVLDDDVLVPAAGILDVLENYAFVRTSGYLPGTEDVYLSLSLVRKFGLRRGDAVKGQVRQPREGERREKFNPMVRIDGVNGAEPSAARARPDFDALVAVHPTERIRLETGPDDLTGRVLDVAAPIGKGQRCLVRSAPRAGRTALLRSLAESVTTNCPDAHLMVVLLHERPEEITDFRRAIAGEVVASEFDRQPSDHVGVAELAIERAKRLVELGHDVVVLLDGLTRLARAHHHAGVADGGRGGGLDVTALQPAKQFFGAARALEEGGSLTVVATVSTDTLSGTDEMVVEELEGTANAEVRLSRALADAGLHPAVDLAGSGTRHEDLLLGEQERSALDGFRAVVARAGDEAASLGLLLERLRATRTNIEMLTRVTKTAR